MANYNIPTFISGTISDFVSFHDEDYYLETIVNYDPITSIPGTITTDFVAFHDEDYYLDGPLSIGPDNPLHFGFEI